MIDRRGFLKGLGLISVPLIVSPKLIFDYGANAHLYKPIQYYPLYPLGMQRITETGLEQYVKFTDYIKVNHTCSMDADFNAESINIPSTRFNFYDLKTRQIGISEKYYNAGEYGWIVINTSMGFSGTVCEANLLGNK